jgi:hypothetical protein
MIDEPLERLQAVVVQKLSRHRPLKAKRDSYPKAELMQCVSKTTLNVENVKVLDWWLALACCDNCLVDP